MPYVVLITEPDKLTDHAEQDMHRWWRHKAVKKTQGDEVWFEVKGRFARHDGARRFGSFGVPARVVLRP